MRKILTTLLIALISIGVKSQVVLPFFSNSDDIEVSVSNSGTYKNMSVEVSNNTSDDMKILFPEGSVFINSTSTQQNLVIVFPEEFELSAGESKRIIVYTACMDPSKSAPSSSRNWTLSYEKKVGDLIRGYHDNRSMVEMMTGAEHHNTFDKRHNFLQMSVWVYYNADKQQILNFATQYMFDGNRQQASAFVDVFYPMAVLFINLYKSF